MSIRVIINFINMTFQKYFSNLQQGNYSHLKKQDPSRDPISRTYISEILNRKKVERQDPNLDQV